MTADHLRIGNYVGATLAGHVDPTGHPDHIGNGQVLHQIKNGADIDNAWWYFDIPLSEDWLERLGLEKTTFKPGFGLRYYYMGIDFYVMEGQFRFYLHTNRHWCYYESVHEVQNLFYSLDEELTIKEKSLS